MNRVQMRLTKAFTELVSPTNSGEKISTLCVKNTENLYKNALKKPRPL